MIVVADTSPINYLIFIGEINLLKQLYSRVLIPSAVLTELQHPLAPKSVREWAVNPPSWLETRNPKTSIKLPQLDAGESEAISLAAEVHADVVLIDDRAGREEAVARGLKVAGTLAILDEADRAGLVVFDEAISKLRNTSFRLSPAILSQMKQKRPR